MNHKRTAVLFLGTALIIIGCLVYRSPLGSRWRFLYDLDRVKVGMSYAEVEAIMGQYIKGRGHKWQIPTTQSTIVPVNPVLLPGGSQFDGSLTYRHSESKYFDSDWGVVTFRGGRVSTIEFMPD